MPFEISPTLPVLGQFENEFGLGFVAGEAVGAGADVDYSWSSTDDQISSGFTLHVLIADGPEPEPEPEAPGLQMPTVCFAVVGAVHELGLCGSGTFFKQQVTIADPMQFTDSLRVSTPIFVEDGLAFLDDMAATAEYDVGSDQFAFEDVFSYGTAPPESRVGFAIAGFSETGVFTGLQGMIDGVGLSDALVMDAELAEGSTIALSDSLSPVSASAESRAGYAQAGYAEAD